MTENLTAKENVQMRGAESLRNEAYIKYAAVTKVFRNEADGRFPLSSVPETGDRGGNLPFAPDKVVAVFLV